MKKLSKFQKIYICVFGGLLLVGIIFLIVLFAWLCRYESNAQIKEQQKADYIKALEEEANYQDAVYKIDNCVQIMNGMIAAKEHAEGYYEISYNSSPGVFAQSIEDEIKNEGFSYLCSFEGFLSELETRSSVSGYVNASYDKNGVRHTIAQNGETYVCEYFCNDVRVALVTLVIDGKNEEYGIPLWTVGESKNLFPKHDYTVKAPENAKVFANGFELEMGTSSVCDIMTSLEGIIKTYNMRSFTAKGLTAPPQMTAMLDGKSLSSDENGNFLYPDLTLSESDKAALSHIVLDYSAYIAGDIRFSHLKESLLAEAPLYNRMDDFDNRWYAEHDLIENTPIVFKDVQRYDDECISFTASYTQKIYLGGKLRKEVDVSVMLLAVLRDGKWLAAEALTI